MSVTVQGRLPFGVVSDGETYRDFELRAGTLRDSVEAVEACGPDASNLVLRYAVLARRLTFLDAPITVTHEDLFRLLDRDVAAIQAAEDALEKKLDALSTP